MGVVYSATHRKSGKIYVGLTQRSLAVRRQEHYASVAKGSRLAFHAALRAHGARAFSWTEHYTSNSPKKLGLKERELIKRLGSHISKKGYNLTWGGELGGGLVVTPEGEIVSQSVPFDRGRIRNIVHDLLFAVKEAKNDVTSYRRSYESVLANFRGSGETLSVVTETQS